MYCRNCGKGLNADDRFCSGCGTRVSEAQKETAAEPMFFLEKSEMVDKPTEKRARKVVHTDEFSWNLDGYPTTTKKTEDVNFDWASVLDDRAKKESPRRMISEPEEHIEEIPRTVEELLEDLPTPASTGEAEASSTRKEDDVTDRIKAETEMTEAEALNHSPTNPAEGGEGEPTELPVGEDASARKMFDADLTPVNTDKPMEEEKSITQLIEEMGSTKVEEPTRLISKSQLKAESVDRFYIFSKKQAEYQAVLDQEYDKIQNSLLERNEETAVEAKPTDEERPEAQPLETEAKEEATVTSTELTERTSEEPREPELVAVIWANTPAGIFAASRQEKGDESVPEEADVESPEKEEPVKPAEKKEKKNILHSQGSETMKLPAADSVDTSTEKAEEHEYRNTIVIRKPETDKAEAVEQNAEEDEAPGITFADIFREEDDEEEATGGSRFLKAVAIVLVILVILELGVLGIQYFAPDSKAGQMINEMYQRVAGLFVDSDADASTEERDGTVELQEIIDRQSTENENILSISADEQLLFEEGKSYGYEDFSTGYAFQNSPWYETEDDKTVSYGDCLVSTIIRYYSALADKRNGINKDILDYVEKTSLYYEEVDALPEDQEGEYIVNELVFGEIRTGEEGFYVLLSVTAADKEQPDGVIETQVVYLTPDLQEKVMKIEDVKTI